MVRKHPLTPEEKLLWEHITRNDKPLKIDHDAGEAEEKIEILKRKSVVKSKTIKPPEIDKSPTLSNKDKKIGDYAGIDRKTAENFRKGDAPIDARLDLHGMTQENAHRALLAFIQQQIKLENRRLLVITGKGSGILRSALPHWLASSGLNGAILAFDVAKAKHGGNGAYYILLRRKRT